jgi:UDP-N-acetylmuramyl pentapeptide phosphotransferase/UDP-N-acetylglucosamine-1-phosphate transferase
VFGASAAISYGATFAVTWLLKRAGIFDRPNERSSHTAPTPRGAGLAVILAVAGAPIAFGAPPLLPPALIACLALLTSISFIDDIRSIPAAPRLVCHLAAAVGAIHVSGLPSLAASSWGGVLAALAAAAWIVAYTNAFNFMDGINGLASGQAVVSTAATGFLALGAGLPPEHPAVLLAFALSGASLGFFPHNFPRARAFLGDAGSIPLGFLQASLVVWVGADAGGRIVLPLLLLHANFILDAGITLARRALRGDRLHTAHREHFYQLLVRSGVSHARATSLLLGLQCCCIAAILLVYPRVPAGAKAAVTASVLVAWLAVFRYILVRFKRLAPGDTRGASRGKDCR